MVLTVDNTAGVWYLCSIMGKLKEPISALLRQALLDSDKTLRQIALEAGVDPAAVWRFARGHRTLTLPCADRVAAVLGLKLVQDKPKTKKRGR